MMKDLEKMLPKKREVFDYKERNIQRGDRVYNGLPSVLMNKIYDGLIAREEDVVKMKGWAVLSLYLARTCNVIEREIDNSALSASLDALCKRVVGVEEVWNEIEQYYIAYIADDEKARELAQALTKSFIVLRREE
jgi:hypothetical protein